jgi:hypothetical protein
MIYIDKQFDYSQLAGKFTESAKTLVTDLFNKGAKAGQHIDSIGVYNVGGDAVPYMGGNDSQVFLIPEMISKYLDFLTSWQIVAVYISVLFFIISLIFIEKDYRKYMTTEVFLFTVGTLFLATVRGDNDMGSAIVSNINVHLFLMKVAGYIIFGAIVAGVFWTAVEDRETAANGGWLFNTYDIIKSAYITFVITFFTDVLRIWAVTDSEILKLFIIILVGVFLAVKAKRGLMETNSHIIFL